MSSRVSFTSAALFLLGAVFIGALIVISGTKARIAEAKSSVYEVYLAYSDQTVTISADRLDISGACTNFYEKEKLKLRLCFPHGVKPVGQAEQTSQVTPPPAEESGEIRGAAINDLEAMAAAAAAAAVN